MDTAEEFGEAAQLNKKPSQTIFFSSYSSFLLLRFMEIGAVLNFTKCNSALTAQKKHIAQAKFYVKKIPQSCQGNVKTSGS
jgi:hypothetical protein